MRVHIKSALKATVTSAILLLSAQALAYTHRGVTVTSVKLQSNFALITFAKDGSPLNPCSGISYLKLQPSTDVQYSEILRMFQMALLSGRTMRIDTWTSGSTCRFNAAFVYD